MKELTKELVEEKLSLWMIHVRSTSKQTATADKNCNLQKFGILTYLVSAKSESEAIEGFHSIFYNEKFPRIVGIVNITNDSIIDEQYQEDWTDDEHKLTIEHGFISIKKALECILQATPIVSDYSKPKFCSSSEKLIEAFPFMNNKPLKNLKL